MSYVIAAPEFMTAAARDFATIGSTVDAAHAAAAAATVAVTPAAADEVSTDIAHLFSQHAQNYQSLAQQAAAFQGQFVQKLQTSAAAYTSVEDAIVSLLRGLENGLRSVDLAYDSLIVKFITGSEAWINLVPPPLQAFVVGIPFLSLFFVAIPFALALAFIEAIIAAIGGASL